MNEFILIFPIKLITINFNILLINAISKVKEMALTTAKMTTGTTLVAATKTEIIRDINSSTRSITLTTAITTTTKSGT